MKMGTNQKPLVSVLVPAYNVREYIEECLDSLVSQTLKEIEIIVIDDGSTDGTENIVDTYADKDERIKVIHQPNGGYGKAMNAGLDVAKGAYIGIIESDDYCRPEMFEYLYLLCETNNLDIAKSNYYLWYPHQEVKRIFFQISDNIYYDKVINPQNSPQVMYCNSSIWSALYKRDVITSNKIRFTETPGASYQDTAFSVKVWCSVKKAWLCREAFVYYRQDNFNSSVNSREKVYNICYEYDEAVNYARGKNINLIPYIQRLRYSGYIWNYNRIAPKYKMEFSKRMGSDFRLIHKNGEFINKLYSTRDLLKINIIMHFPNLYNLKRRMGLSWL